LGRILSENVKDGTSADEATISEGGLIAGQTAQNTLAVSATQVYTYGTKRVEDGKIYRYGKGSTSAAKIAGTLQESKSFGGATTAAEQDCTVTLGCVAGGSAITVTLKGAETTADIFKDGTIIVADGTAGQGNGQTRKILSQAVSTGAGDSVVITVTEPWTVAVTTDAKVAMLANPYKDFAVCTTSGPLGFIIGYPAVAVPVATPYCWIQRRGLCGVLSTTGAVVGRELYRDVAAGGGGGVVESSTSAAMRYEAVGYVAMSGDATDNIIAYLTIE